MALPGSFEDKEVRHIIRTVKDNIEARERFEELNSTMTSSMSMLLEDLFSRSETILQDEKKASGI